MLDEVQEDRIIKCDKQGAALGATVGGFDDLCLPQGSLHPNGDGLSQPPGMERSCGGVRIKAEWCPIPGAARAEQTTRCGEANDNNHPEQHYI